MEVLIVKFFYDIAIYVLVFSWFIIFINNAVRSKYFIDGNNRLIFYPDTNKKGYVATQEQINECTEAFKKCFFFNVKGYRKDIERIFANSEVIEKTLPRQIFLKNQAARMSWPVLISLMVINFAAMYAAWIYKPLFLVTVIALIPALQLAYYKLKRC